MLQHDELRAIQDAVGHVRVSDALVDYVLRLVEATRTQPQFAWGCRRAAPGVAGGCPRLGIPRRTRLRDSEDVQAVLPTVVGHRLRERADATGHGGGALVQWLLREVPAL